MKKYICIILVLAFCMSILTACGEKDTSGKGFSMAVSELPQTFDPQIAQTQSEKIIALNCFDTLLRPDENGTLQCLAAESYSVSADDLTYTVKIRKGLKYFVSEKAKAFIEEKGGAIPGEITAKDFAFGITRACLPETQAPDFVLISAIKNAEAVRRGEMSKDALGVKATDDYTLVITLERPDDGFLFSLSQPITAACNEQFFDLTAGRYGLEPKYTVFNGGFYVSYTGSETSVKISKNTEYKGANVAVPSSVNFYLNNDINSVAGKIKKGNYDCGFVDSSSVKVLPNSVTKTNFTNVTYSLIFNLSKEEFKRADMRRGLVCAIDFDSLDMERARGIVAPRYLLSGNTVSNNDVSQAKYDVQGARRELTEAFSELEISTLKVNIVCTGENESIAKKIISLWQKNIGVELNGTLTVLSKDEFYAAIAKKDFDMAIYPISAETGNAVDFMSIFESSEEDNFLGYNSEEYDRIFENLKNNQTSANLTYAQSFLIENAVVTPLYFDSQYFCVGESVSGIYFVSDMSNVYFYKGRKQ